MPLWDDLLADWEDSRRGATQWFAFLHPDGYLLYRVHGRHPKTVRVEEFNAATPDAHVALWRALLGLDLVETIVARSHPADPLPYLLTDSRLVRTTASEDGLWLRIMDVPAALEARTYQADLDTVIEVGDEFRSDGGRFALQIRDGGPAAPARMRGRSSRWISTCLAACISGRTRSRPWLRPTASGAAIRHRWRDWTPRSEATFPRSSGFTSDRRVPGRRG